MSTHQTFAAEDSNPTAKPSNSSWMDSAKTINRPLRVATTVSFPVVARWWLCPCPWLLATLTSFKASVISEASPLVLFMLSTRVKLVLAVLFSLLLMYTCTNSSIKYIIKKPLHIIRAARYNGMSGRSPDSGNNRKEMRWHIKIHAKYVTLPYPGSC